MGRCKSEILRNLLFVEEYNSMKQPPLARSLAGSPEADRLSSEASGAVAARRVPEFYFYAELARAVAESKPVFVVPPLIEWNVPLFQRPQQMALALAKKGAFVVFFSTAERYDSFEGFIELQKNLFLASD